MGMSLRQAGCIVLLVAGGQQGARAELNSSVAEFLWAPYDAEEGQVPVEYLLLRKELKLAQPASQLASAVVEVTARQANPKILSAYKLWVNGEPISNGPGRNAHCKVHLQPRQDWRDFHCNETAQGYDVVDVTAALRAERGGAGAAAAAAPVLALQGWYWAGNSQSRGHGSQGGIMLLLTMRFTDGSSQTVPTEATNATSTGNLDAAEEPWLAFNATAAFNPGAGIGGMYFQPAENMIMALWPKGWRLPGYVTTAAAGWTPAVGSTEPGARGSSMTFAAKEAAAVVQRYRPVTALKPVIPANCSGYRYIVDMGRELQGGIQLSINGTGFENRSFLVRLGETLLSNGSVRAHMTAGCHYEERWTLTHGLNLFDMGQEYKEWRWAELLELPAPIQPADVGAWVVHYPLDFPEGGSAAAPPPPLPGGGGAAAAQQAPSPFPADRPPGTPSVPYGDRDTITAFHSGDEKLDAVWELGRWTILTTSLDVNTDSNTRQRDNCMIDAYITAMGQFSVGAAVQLQRRTLEYVMYNGYNFDGQHGKGWSENHMVTVLAARELLLRHGPVGRKLAKEFYPTLLTLTLSPKYYVEAEGLLVKGEPTWESGGGKKSKKCFDPKDACAHCEPDLIDSPPKYLDGYCNQVNRSIVINSYSAQTLDALATIATELGQPDDAAQLQAQASKMRAAMLDRMVDYDTNLFLDGVFATPSSPSYNSSFISSHSAISSQYFAVGFGVLDQAPAATQAKLGTAIMALVHNKTLDQKGEPSCSCMGGHWLLEALYTLARSPTPELSEGASGGVSADAAASALAFLVHPGTWLGMIGAGATATMEVWTPSDKPNLSWSHPWCSAPANIIPRRLMGVQPLGVGYSHFEVIPQPGSLAWATLTLPTVKGKIELRFNNTPSAFAASLTVPSGSTARVCLPPLVSAPAAAESSGTGVDKLRVDGAVVSGVVLGRMLCAPANLTAGAHNISRYH